MMPGARAVAAAVVVAAGAVVPAWAAAATYPVGGAMLTEETVPICVAAETPDTVGV